MLIDTGAKKLIAGFGMFFVVYLMNRIRMISLILIVLEVMTGSVVYVLLLMILRDEWTCGMVKSAIGKVRKTNG